jgi:peptidoglycan/xylan/chitin deacetylase (PgdA/CDA1 family)
VRSHALPRGAAGRAVLSVVVLLAPLLVAAELGDRPPPITVTVGGEPVRVTYRSTFGEAIDALDLRARPGRLLAVDGAVLDPRARPGSIEVNGKETARRTMLVEGDAITVMDGEDVTEGTRRLVERLPRRQLANPMYTLATSEMLEITTVGRVSGTVASVEYRAVGKAKAPPAVALTFDDGPWPDGTRRVLDVLERMHVKATFFMVGYLIERYPEIVRRVRAAGMTIGTHSWSHPYRTPLAELTPHRVETEVTAPADLLRRRFGIEPGLFRPPGGSYDADVIGVAREAGMRVVMWSIDPHDYLTSASPRRIAADVLRAVRPGSIVLLHDGGGDPAATIRALPRIIRGIRQMGLDLVTL